MTVSFEAIARVRKRGSLGPFETKWMTVTSPDLAAARRAFEALGYDTAGISIHTQPRATELAGQCWPA